MQGIYVYEFMTTTGICFHDTLIHLGQSILCFVPIPSMDDMATFNPTLWQLQLCNRLWRHAWLCHCWHITHCLHGTLHPAGCIDPWRVGILRRKKRRLECWDDQGNTKKSKNIYGKNISHHTKIHQIHPLLFVEHNDHLWKHPAFQYLQLPFDVYINYECTPLVMMSVIGVRPDSGTRCTVVSERKWMKQHILPRKLTAGTHKLVVL